LVIVDVFAIAFGFVLRVAAGAAVINVQPSHWLLICAMLLALLLGLVKRRYELIVLKGNARDYKRVFGGYSIHLLEKMISMVAASTILFYAFYAISGQESKKFSTKSLIFTLPFVAYGILRYLFLIYRKENNADPESILISDKPLMINIFLWVTAVGLILYG